MLMPLVRKGKGRGFLRLPAFTQLWFIPVWLLLGMARVMILIISFPRLARTFGHPLGVAAWVPLADTRQRARARQVGRAIRVAARYTPWTSNCFPQALAARLLLAMYRVPCTLCFGLVREAGTVKAHAWIVCGPVAVTGGASFGHYTVVGAFASCPPRAA